MEEQATRAKAPWTNWRRTNWRRASFHKQSKDLNSTRIARLQGSRSLISSRRDHLLPRPAAQFLQDVICRRRADDVVITAVDSTSLLSSLLLIVASRVLSRHIIILSDISSFSPRSHAAPTTVHPPPSPTRSRGGSLGSKGRVAGLDERVAGLDERASFGPAFVVWAGTSASGTRPQRRHVPRRLISGTLVAPVAVSRQSRPSSPSPTRTGYVDWLDERASVGLAPVRVPASGLARGLLASLAGDDTPRVR